jgi:hypothetical protein
MTPQLLTTLLLNPRLLQASGSPQLPESAPPPGSTPIRTDEEMAADLEALAAEYRQRAPKTSSYEGMTKKKFKWQARFRGVYLGLLGSDEEAALAHDQALLLHLGR